MSLLHQGPGVFFLFVALVLLIVVSVGAPVWNAVDFLKATINGQQIRLGQWGYCVVTNGAEVCSKSKLGYRAEDIVNSVADIGNIGGTIIGALTYALVLHPIAAGFTLLAIVVSLTNNVILDILGSLVSFFAFLVCLVALIIDSILFVTARHRINSDLAGSPAALANAYWLVVAATIALLLASITVCFGSATTRRQKRRREREAEYAAAGPVMTEPKRHFWQRNRY